MTAGQASGTAAGAPRAHRTRGAGAAGQSLSTRERIVDAAMRLFAERGYQDTRVDEVATEAGVAKASVFQHFSTKEGLFLACYRAAVRSFPAYLDAPPEVLARGFFETIRYWLGRTERLVREDWVPYRVALLGAHGTDLKVRRAINRFLVAEDPYGTVEFVRFGVERGEVRADIDAGMVVAMLDWLMERFQDALLTEELDPGLFRASGNPQTSKDARVEQFLELLTSAIGTRR